MNPGHLADGTRPDRVPDLWEEYERLRTVGRGAFGEAILIRRLSDRRKFVAKEIPAVNTKDRDNGCREIEMLKRASGHPNIVRYCDHYELPEVIYLVMEYASGGTLKSALADRRAVGRFREEKVTTWFVQLILALKHIHSCTLLHRDIKPANIFFTSRGVLKLGDFGLTKVLEESSCANTACGTPYYFSPEICERVPYNSKSDMWAAGCMLYEMIMLRHPFTAKTLKGLQSTIMSVRLSAPLDEEYSEPLRKLCMQLLSRAPADRPSAAEVLRLPEVDAHVRRYLKYVEELGLQEPTQAYKPPPARRRLSQTAPEAKEPDWTMATLNTKREGQEQLRDEVAKLRAMLNSQSPPPQGSPEPTGPAGAAPAGPAPTAGRSASAQSAGSAGGGDEQAARPSSTGSRRSSGRRSAPKRQGSGGARRRPGSGDRPESGGDRAAPRGPPPAPGRLDSGGKRPVTPPRGPAAGSAVEAAKERRREQQEGPAAAIPALAQPRPGTIYVAGPVGEDEPDAEMPAPEEEAAEDERQKKAEAEVRAGTLTAEEQQAQEAADELEHQQLLATMREQLQAAVEDPPAEGSPDAGAAVPRPPQSQGSEAPFRRAVGDRVRAQAVQDAAAISVFARRLKGETRSKVGALLEQLPFSAADGVGLERRCQVFDDLMELLGPVGSVRHGVAVHRLVFADG